MGKLTFHNGEFVWFGTYDERLIAKRAGFYFSDEYKVWYTPNPAVAARLRDYADVTAKEKLNRLTIEESPWSGRLAFPKRHKPWPWQNTAAHFALSRNHSYLGLDPRMGKAIVSQMIINSEQCNAIFISPPFPAASTEEKMRDWACGGITLGRFGFPRKESFPNVLIVPDSVLTRPTTLQTVKSFAELSHRSNRPLRLFVDEAHRFKEPTSQRTKALRKIARWFPRLTFLSGTPMPSRPMELYEVLSKYAPSTIDYMSRHEFGLRYCQAHETPFGWDYTGAANLEELAERIKPFMLRMRRDDLPTIEEMVLVDDILPPTAARLDKELLREFSPNDLMGHIAPNGHVATYRKELGIAKAPHALKYIEQILTDNPDDKLLVFCLHREVARILQEGLEEKFGPLVVTGETPMREREACRKEFQENPKRRLWIGNIQATNLGLDLNKASRALFVEFSWVPSDNKQAADRTFLYGKTENTFVEYLVFRNSMDRFVLEVNLKKRKSTDII